MIWTESDGGNALSDAGYAVRRRIPGYRYVLFHHGVEVRAYRTPVGARRAAERHAQKGLDTLTEL